eukprot:3462690-Amphidinium_carterae.1
MPKRLRRFSYSCKSKSKNMWKVNRTYVRPTTSEESQGQEPLQRYLQTVTEELKGSSRGPKRFMDGTREPEPPSVEDREEEGRASKQPRLTEPLPHSDGVSEVQTTQETPGVSSAAGVPFRSGQVSTPQRPTTMPFPAPATWIELEEVPEITLRDTTIKEIAVKDLHPKHQDVFLRDPNRGRCKDWRSIVDSDAVRVHVGAEAQRLQAKWPEIMVPSRWLDRWKHAGV